MRFSGADRDAVVVSGQVHTPNNEILTIGAWNPNVTLGDVNSDGEITVLDAMCVAQYIVGDIGADKMSVNAADVNGDGEITVLDAMLIAQFIVGDIDSFEQANTQNNMNHTDRESVVLEKPANNNAPMQSIGQAAGDDATGLYGAANNLYGDADNNLSDKDTGSEEADPTEAPSNDPADTGDTFPMRTLIIVMILCAAGVVALVVIGKKKGE